MLVGSTASRVSRARIQCNKRRMFVNEAARRCLANAANVAA
jgi:hypothetical protein